MKLKPIEEQVVVVMGASSGIGRETALRFAERGAKVVVSARREEALDSLVEEIKSTGGEATAVPADTSVFEEVKAVADKAVETYGRLDTWVHVAGISVYAPFEQTTPEEFQRVVDVNLVGQAFGAMVALPHLRRTGQGALIHISSVEAERALPWHSAYAASKHGIKGFLDALRVELEHDNVPISVTNLMPASINTPFFDNARTKLGVKPRPVPPVYEPNVVADAILYAAENPVRDVFAGGAGQGVAASQRLSRKATDAMLGATAFDMQRTDQPKGVDVPDNVFGTVPGDYRVQGSFSDEARSWSLYTWMETHPLTAWLATGAAVAGVAVLGGKLLGNRDG